MTRKDYKLIAETFQEMTNALQESKSWRGEEKTSGYLALIRELTNNLSDKLQAENPRFNREIFWKASGLN